MNFRTKFIILCIFLLSLSYPAQANNDRRKAAVLQSIKMYVLAALGFNASEPLPQKSDLPEGALEKFQKENPAFLANSLRGQDPNQLVRSKRDGPNCQKNDEEKKCCRFPLEISFKEFGWDWIHTPNSYNSSYCAGECLINYHITNDHTHLVQLANATHACCSPTRMSPISILYQTKHGQLKTRTLSDMVVEECGCAA